MRPAHARRRARGWQSRAHRHGRASRFRKCALPLLPKRRRRAAPLFLCRRVPKDTSSMLAAAQARPHAIATRWPRVLSFSEAKRAGRRRRAPPFLLPAAPSRVSPSPPSTLPPSTQHQFNRHAWWAAGRRAAKGAAQSPSPPPPKLATIGRELGAQKSRTRPHSLPPLPTHRSLRHSSRPRWAAWWRKRGVCVRCAAKAKGVETNAARRRTSEKQQAKCRHPHGHTHNGVWWRVCGGGQKKARAPKGSAAFCFVLRL